MGMASGLLHFGIAAGVVGPAAKVSADTDRGGHFAAWEQPELFTQEVRAGFRSLR
jgi:pimeloyl-ACP methyl ester carboxylesterase